MRVGKPVLGYSLAVEYVAEYPFFFSFFFWMTLVAEHSGTWMNLHDLEGRHAAEPAVSVEVRRWRTW